jgi:hypothetical protein
MPRWDLVSRDTVPASRLVEPKPTGEGRRLSSGEVRYERLRLAHDMVLLVLDDGEGLPPELLLELRAVSKALVTAWRATRSLP